VSEELAAAAGIEPAAERLTVALLYQHRHRNTSPTVRMAGFEPAISCARGTRSSPLSYILLIQLHNAEYVTASSSLTRRASLERPAGIEPAFPPWQGSRLPLHHGRDLELGTRNWELGK
jgi:hypothetical protein